MDLQTTLNVFCTCPQGLLFSSKNPFWYLTTPQGLFSTNNTALVFNNPAAAAAAGYVNDF